MTVGEIIGLIGGIVAILVGLCTIVVFVSNKKKDGYSEGVNDGGIYGDIKYMRNSLDDLRLDVKEIARNQDQLGERLTRVEESCKQAHKRLDHMEGVKR